jgi:hypothetical protein
MSFSTGAVGAAAAGMAKGSWKEHLITKLEEYDCSAKVGGGSGGDDEDGEGGAGGGGAGGKFEV